MRQKTMRGLQVLRRAHGFLATNQLTCALGPVTKHVEALGQSVERLATYAVDQDENVRGFRGSASGARQKATTLRIELMRPIARMAQLLFTDNAELQHALAMPESRSYEKLIAAALAMAGQADEHKDRFVAAGFGEDFVDPLRLGAAELRTALDTKAVHYGKRSAATAGMIEELRRSKRLVRVLDDLVSPGLRSTPDRLAQWRTLSRFVRASPVGEEVVTQPHETPNAPPVAVSVVLPSAPTIAPLAESPVTRVAPSDAAVVDRAA
jgi:hypothetical protein